MAGHHTAISDPIAADRVLAGKMLAARPGPASFRGRETERMSLALTYRAPLSPLHAARTASTPWAWPRVSDPQAQPHGSARLGANSATVARYSRPSLYTSGHSRVTERLASPFPPSAEPASLQRFQEAELIHCRWAMLGVAGCLGVEVLGQGDWFDAPKWALEGGTPKYFGQSVPFDLATLTAIELVMMAAAESQRGNEADPEKRKYPGGAFDPFGFSKEPANFDKMKLRELKNVSLSQGGERHRQTSGNRTRPNIRMT